MKFFPLFRRRQIWLPTFSGWLLQFAIAGALCYFAWGHVYGFLAENDPAPTARLLVIEGWMPATELDQAAAIFRKGHYDRVVTTGGPVDRWPDLLAASSYAELAAHYLKTHGLRDVRVAVAPAPASAQDRSYLSAVKLREWIVAQGVKTEAVDVVSAGVHARRSRMVYQMALGSGVEVGIIAARTSEYDDTQWWRTSAGAKGVIGETISLVWTVCCFHPPPPGSREELWGKRQGARGKEQGAGPAGSGEPG